MGSDLFFSKFSCTLVPEYFHYYMKTSAHDRPASYSSIFHLPRTYPPYNQTGWTSALVVWRLHTQIRILPVRSLHTHPIERDARHDSRLLRQESDYRVCNLVMGHTWKPILPFHVCTYGWSVLIHKRCTDTVYVTWNPNGTRTCTDRLCCRGFFLAFAGGLLCSFFLFSSLL